MACRVVEDTASNSFIIKSIPFDECLLTVSWPEPTIANEAMLKQCFNECGCNNAIKTAIIQQYNEIFLYNEVDTYTRQILAPQCGILYNDKNRLPKIIYPKFKPLCDDKTIWQYNEQNCLVLFGFLAAQNQISRYDLFTFIEQVKEFCTNWNLCEDDILLNPSNIGVHPVFGLRILDYGLTSGRTILNV